MLNGFWLTDKHIVAAQKLLKIQHSNINGLEDPLLLAERFQYKSTANSFVQIINLGRTHWVCASSINCPSGVVDVYDSIPACSFGSSSLKSQVAAILQTSELSFELHIVETQRQSGWSECGLFSFVFATALCQGIDPHNCSFDQTQMRVHLHHCFEEIIITIFPPSKKPRQMGLKRWHRIIGAKFGVFGGGDPPPNILIEGGLGGPDPPILLIGGGLGGSAPPINSFLLIV